MKKLLTVLVMSLAVLAAGCDKLTNKPPAFNNTDVTGLDYAKGFTLTDHTGTQRTLHDFKGKLVVLFFGYTQCPDVCPTTMAEMAAVMKDLGPASKDVQVLFVTLDPERDTQELLAAYVPAFHPSFIGLYGDKDATARTAKEYKVISVKRPSGDDPKNYTVDHSAGSYVYDREGRLRLYVQYGKGPATLAADLRQLL